MANNRKHKEHNRKTIENIRETIETRGNTRKTIERIRKTIENNVKHEGNAFVFLMVVLFSIGFLMKSNIPGRQGTAIQDFIRKSIGNPL